MLDLKYGESFSFFFKIRTPATPEKSLDQLLVVRLQFWAH